MRFLAPFIWIRPEVQDHARTESGVILSTFKPRPNTGVVIGIGLKCDMDYLNGLKVGDRVTFNPDHITKQDYPEKDDVTIPYKNLIGVIPGDADVKVEDHEL